MGLPFVIVEGAIFIVGTNGLIADVVPSGSQNRLAVTSAPALPSATIVKYNTTKLLDGASSSMTVDGSGTPVDYQIAPGAGKIFFIEYIRIAMRDDGALKLDEFGSQLALTNGLRLRIQTNAVLANDFVMKNNEDIICNTDSLVTLDQFQGSPLLLYQINFKQNMTLIGDQSDFLRITVQDDLTNVESLSATTKYWEV